MSKASVCELVLLVGILVSSLYCPAGRKYSNDVGAGVMVVGRHDLSRDVFPNYTLCSVLSPRIRCESDSTDWQLFIFCLCVSLPCWNLEGWFGASGSLVCPRPPTLPGIQCSTLIGRIECQGNELLNMEKEEAPFYEPLSAFQRCSLLTTCTSHISRLPGLEIPVCPSTRVVLVGRDGVCVSPPAQGIFSAALCVMF